MFRICTVQSPLLTLNHDNSKLCLLSFLYINISYLTFWNVVSLSILRVMPYFDESVAQVKIQTAGIFFYRSVDRKVWRRES